MPGLLQGAASVFRGAALAARPGVRHFAYIPLLVNILVFAGLIWLSGEAFDRLLDHYLSGTESIWWSVLRWILWLLFSAAMVLITFFAFTLAANLVASPFNEALAGAVAAELGHGGPETGHSWKEIVAAFPTAIGQEVVKLIYFACWLLPALLLFLVPGLQIVAPLVWVGLAIWFLALEYTEYPATNDQQDFKALRERARSHRGLLLGFGGTVFGLALIPGLNLILIPIAVSGATVLWVRHMRPGTGDDR